MQFSAGALPQYFWPQLAVRWEDVSECPNKLQYDSLTGVQTEPREVFGGNPKQRKQHIPWCVTRPNPFTVEVEPTGLWSFQDVLLYRVNLY